MSTTALSLDFVHADVCLSSGHTLSLRDAAGVVLTSLRGRVWLTMEGENRDLDLGPGVTYTIERDGLTLVSAFERSLVQFRVPHPRHALWRDRINRFWVALVCAAEARAAARIARGNWRF